MRVGVYRGFPASAGGGFQYEASLLDALSDLTRHVPYDLVCVNPAGESLRGILQSRHLQYGRLPILPLGDLDIHQGPPESYLSTDGEGGRPPPPTDEIVLNTAMGWALREEDVDLLLTLHPSLIGPEALLPFIVPIHDLQHRLQPEFPEVSADGIAALREQVYRTICRYATLVLVDSEAGRQDVLRFYGDLIDGDRIRVLPFFPPVRRSRPPTERDFARVRTRYGLPERYYFYPAQFWMHKNHRLIVEALAQLADGGDEAVRVVFAGSYTEKWRARNFIDVMALADRLGVRDRIHYLGFVPDRDMPALYSLSAGLVMPTFFGPTNMPPLEAWSVGRPVIVSDLPSIRDQLGDGALYIDPRDAASLAGAMRGLWHDDALAATLAANGACRLAGYRHEDFLSRLRSILDEAVDRVRTRRTPAYPIAWPQEAGGVG
ncbi:glycosyltransferase family 1 protein [Azospirillum sp. TSH100]|uniref:glycosyltransferase family 4 protein n=1 Tax=Azospirillum sp. TSH100 TaxID=652764 RepID=UPI001304B2AD|nr:glycosyltransferase family 1 protein [Azospirillum sp. TSH100]